MNSIGTSKKTVHTVEDGGGKRITAESHAGAERVVLRREMRDSPHLALKEIGDFIDMFDEAEDPERLALLLHDYANPRPRGRSRCARRKRGMASDLQVLR